MKYLIQLITLSFICYSCNDNVSNKAHNICLKNITSSSCVDNQKSSSIDDINEYIKFYALDNKILKVEQKVFVNCCSEDVNITINSENKNIAVNVADVDQGCNCICPIILSYEIVNLQENNAYNLIFLRNDQEYYTCELLFTINVNNEVQL